MSRNIFTKNKDVLVLISRLIIGGIFINAGWLKISDMAQTIGFFQTLGIPAFLAYIVGYAEFIGGVLLVLGLFVEMSVLVLAIIMIVAVCLTRGGGVQMFGLPLTMLAALLLAGISGPGRYALRLKKRDEAIASNL